MNKLFKKLSTVALAGAAALSLSACGKDSAKEDNEVKTKIEDKTTITFWHSMNGPQEQALKKLTADFEKKNPNITVKLQNQGQYKDLQAKVNSTLQSPKDLPTITQAYPTWLYTAAQEDMLVDLKPYMTNEKIGWKNQEKISNVLLKGAQIDGKQYGMPFNKSTEVLFYNEDMLKKYGVSVPKTMEELKTASQTIYKKSNGKVVGAGCDSLQSYYVTGLKNDGITFSKDVNFDGKDSKAIINYYADGVKDGYFRTVGADQFLSTPFANKQVAMYIGSSAGEGFVQKDTKGKFQYNVAPRPSKYALQQGTDIYMFSSAKSEQRTAAYLYMKFLASPENQLYWAKQTGYIPIVDSVKNSEEYKKSSKGAAQMASATENLFSLPVTETSNNAFNEVATIMEKILADPKNENVNKMIKESTTDFQDAWAN